MLTSAARRSNLRAIAIGCAVGLVGLIALPITALLLQNVGPAARVRVYAYLISTQSAALCAWAALVAVLLGIETHRRLVRRQAAGGAAARRGFMRSTALALLVLAAWILWPHLDAFPATGSAQARDAWARSHVPQYAVIARLPAELPAVTGDVGKIQLVAPTGGDSHGCGQSMNGFDLSFALDVIGDRGRGVLRIDCSADLGAIVEWRSASWHFSGHTTPVPAPASARLRL